MTLLGGLLEAIGVALVAPILILIIDSESIKSYPYASELLTYFGLIDQKSILISGILFLIFAYIFKFLYLSILYLVQARYIFGLKSFISFRLYQSYIDMPYSKHISSNSAYLIRNISSEVQELVSKFIYPFVLMISEIVVVTLIVMILVLFQPLTALVVGVIVVLSTLAFQFVTKRKLGIWGAKRQENEGLRIKHAQEGLSAIKDIKIYKKENYFLDSYRIRCELSSYYEANQLALIQVPRLWLEFIGVMSLIIVVVISIKLDYDKSVIISSVAFFGAAAFRILPSANRVLNSLQSTKYAESVLNLIVGEIGKITKLNKLEVTPLDIGLVNVSYAHENSTSLLLKNINLDIPFGSCIGIVGESGSGKSTLIDIISGLISPNSGYIKINNVCYKNTSLLSISGIGYVQQQILLIDDTLLANIALGVDNEEVDFKKLNRVIDLAGLRPLVADSPLGVNLIVGERGVKLSGGQRQRIGIARALYNDSSVLIFDEATSALDEVNEALVMDSIFDLKGEKTIILIAHRISTLKFCDQIFKIDNGNLIKFKT